ncbi:hypothetical protein JW935_27035, partial [candidate division KSB1 bacterium]|nr:hypothetical protein [candidate division KSB1 bacterium]
SEYNDQSECHRHHKNNSQHFRGDWNAVVVKDAPRLHFWETSLPTAATIFNPSDRVSTFHSIDRNLRIPFGIIYEHTNKSPPLSLI